MDIIEIKMKIKWTLKHEISVFDIYLFTEILKIINNFQNLYHQVRMKMIEINPVSIQYQIKSIAKSRMENSYSNQQSILRQYFKKIAWNWVISNSYIFSKRLDSFVIKYDGLTVLLITKNSIAGEPVQRQRTKREPFVFFRNCTIEFFVMNPNLSDLAILCRLGL